MLMQSIKVEFKHWFVGQMYMLMIVLVFQVVWLPQLVGGVHSGVLLPDGAIGSPLVFMGVKLMGATYFIWCECGAGFGHGSELGGGVVPEGPEIDMVLVNVN